MAKDPKAPARAARGKAKSAAPSGAKAAAKGTPVKTPAAAEAGQAGAATVWHNPACGSSKNAVAYLQEKGVAADLYLYLKEKPTKAQIKAVLKRLGMKASQLLRPGEAKGEALGVYGASETAIIDAMAAEPVLIQRPIVLTDKGAVVARPKTRIDEIL